MLVGIYNIVVLILIFLTDQSNQVVDQLNQQAGTDFHGFIFYVIGLLVAGVIDTIAGN